MIVGLFLAMRTGLAVVFLVAAVTKLLDLDLFSRAVADYEIVPAGLAPGAASAISVIELSTAVGLFLGVRIAAAGAAFTLLAFASVVAINLARGRSFDCGCGFGQQSQISWSLVARDCVLAAAAVLLAIGPVSTLAAQGPWVPALIHAGSASASELIPIPLLVVLVMMLSRITAAVGVSRGRHALRARRTGPDRAANPLRGT
jgi:uncharacterized membrane protein YphA (DoxX/SURF4 family)